MRSIAASMAVALAIVVLALCGSGRALAATPGSSVASASSSLLTDSQDLGPNSPADACDSAMAALGIGAANCEAMLGEMVSDAGAVAGGSLPAQPDCHCGTMPTAPATPTCQCMSTPTPTPTCSCESGTQGTGDAPPLGDTPPKSDTPQKADAPPQAGTPQRADAPPKLRDASDVTEDAKGSPILPITGANMEPLAAAASIFLIAGTAALVAGRRGRAARVAPVTGAPGRRRHARGSRRATR